MIGYPVETKFETAAQVADYFGDDTITCLRCGKEYQELAYHIRVAHGWDVDRYKEFYGLPWGHGLISARMFKIRAAVGRKNHEDGVLFNGDWQNNRAGKGKPQREMAPYVKREHVTRLRRTHVANEDMRAAVRGALMAGIQTGVGDVFHPDANALICIAFRNGADAERFHLAYIAMRQELEAEEPIE